MKTQYCTADILCSIEIQRASQHSLVKRLKLFCVQKFWDCENKAKDIVDI